MNRLVLLAALSFAVGTTSVSLVRAESLTQILKKAETHLKVANAKIATSDRERTTRSLGNILRSWDRLDEAVTASRKMRTELEIMKTRLESGTSQGRTVAEIETYNALVSEYRATIDKIDASSKLLQVEDGKRLGNKVLNRPSLEQSRFSRNFLALSAQAPLDLGQMKASASVRKVSTEAVKIPGPPILTDEDLFIGAAMAANSIWQASLQKGLTAATRNEYIEFAREKVDAAETAYKKLFDAEKSSAKVRYYRDRLNEIAPSLGRTIVPTSTAPSEIKIRIDEQPAPTRDVSAIAPVVPATVAPAKRYTVNEFEANVIGSDSRLTDPHTALAKYKDEDRNNESEFKAYHARWVERVTSAEEAYASLVQQGLQHDPRVVAARRSLDRTIEKYRSQEYERVRTLIAQFGLTEAAACRK